MSESKEELVYLERNIIDWYPFKENSKILEIWEGKVLQTSENVEELFDYVVVIGLGEKELSEIVKYSLSKLSENGILLIAVDNKIGINSLCSETTTNFSKKISKKQIEKCLYESGFKNQKFYYPLPNYKYTNVIFTDNFLPNSETISRCLTLYDDSTIVAIDERNRFRRVIDEDENLFKIFSNSFLVECSKNFLEENNIKFVSFSNARKKQYRIKTIIQGDSVYKYAVTQEAREHIENIKNNIDILKRNNLKTIDSYDQERIISKYINNSLLLNNIITEKAKDGKKQEIIELICQFKNELMKKIDRVQVENNCFDKYNIEYEEEDIENLYFIKDGLWDMFFQNCFYIDNEFYFYDQEWKEENLPIEFIMYRAIKYFGKELFDIISVEELYEILNIKSEQIKIFEKLDDILQENIRDKNIWDIHKDNKEVNRLLINIDNLQKSIIQKEEDIQGFEKEILQKEEKIQELEKEIENSKQTIKNQEAELNGIKGSKSWKFARFISRTIGRK